MVNLGTPSILFRVSFYQDVSPFYQRKQIMNQIEKQTIDSYSFLWDRGNKRRTATQKTHFEIVQETLKDPLVRNRLGLEIGCGPGFDIEYMAAKFPANKFIAIDFSNSIFEVNKRLKQFDNVQFVRASALDLPFKSGKFDFVYSFGVLHHTINPEKGIGEINRVLNSNAIVSLYLYENHENNKIKFYILKYVTLARMITTKTPAKVLYLVCCVLSPIVYVLLSLPAKMLDRIETTRHIANKMPFNFGKNPFDLIGDLFDRFRTPVEIRYSKSQLTALLKNSKFEIITLDNIPDTAGWVVLAKRIAE